MLGLAADHPAPLRDVRIRRVLVARHVAAQIGWRGSSSGELIDGGFDRVIGAATAEIRHRRGNIALRRFGDALQ